MDKYDKFIQDVIQKTKAGILVWQVVDNSEVASLVSDYSRILQVYSATFKAFHPREEFVLIEKNRTRYSGDFDSEYEEYAVELMILKGGVRIFTADENYVDKAELISLARLLHEENKDAVEFFSEFDETEE